MQPAMRLAGIPAGDKHRPLRQHLAPVAELGVQLGALVVEQAGVGAGHYAFISQGRPVKLVGKN